MGHTINAVIGHPSVVASIGRAAGAPQPTDLPLGLAIAPLGEDQLDQLGGVPEKTVAPKGFTYLSRGVEQGLVTAAGGGDFIYIETNYFGGAGHQAAAVFSAGSEPVLTHDSFEDFIDRNSPINAALRSIGVVAQGDMDEFDTLGLSRFRCLESLGITYED